MAHIRKHPVTGKPQVRWRDPSGRERSKTFLRSTDARAYAAEIEHEISRGTLFDRSRSKTPFSVAGAAWLEGRVALRRSSWVRDESYLRRHVISFFGGYPVGSITRDLIEEWVRGLSSSGLAPMTARQVVRILRCVLDDCVERGLIASSPFRSLRRIALPRVSSSSCLFLTPSEVSRLASAIEPRFRALVLVAAYLGLRWGELAGLLRSAVDFSTALQVSALDLLAGLGAEPPSPEGEAARPSGPPSPEGEAAGFSGSGSLRVVGTLEEVAGMVRYVEETKSRGGRRTLTVPPFLVSELSGHLSLFGSGGSLVPTSVSAPSLPGGFVSSSSFVFTDVDGGVLRGARFRRRYWRPAVEAAGLPSGLRFHDLRHTCASILIAQGAHPKEIQARLGHSSIRTTLDTYGHLLPNLGARFDEGLERVWREALV
ncbi:MAG: site-specific integrase [Actinobacteria bacterium]|nr:site-specific integrase [Actinomycetota bacterium]